MSGAVLAGLAVLAVLDEQSGPLKFVDALRSRHAPSEKALLPTASNDTLHSSPSVFSRCRAVCVDQSKKVLNTLKLSAGRRAIT